MHNITKAKTKIIISPMMTTGSVLELLLKLLIIAKNGKDTIKVSDY